MPGATNQNLNTVLNLGKCGFLAIIGGDGPEMMTQ